MLERLLLRIHKSPAYASEVKNYSTRMLHNLLGQSKDHMAGPASLADHPNSVPHIHIPGLFRQAA